MTDAILRVLETTAKEWGTPLYLVAGSAVDKGVCGLFAPVSADFAVKHS